MISKRIESKTELVRIYPPRIEIILPPENLERIRGYYAEYKYNDIRTLIHILPGEILLMTRKREPVKEYSLTEPMKNALNRLRLDPTKLHTLDGGIIRHLSIGGEHPIVLWDVLVHDNIPLIDRTMVDRYRLLEKICGHPKKLENSTGHQIGLEVSGALWLAPLFTSNFKARYLVATQVDYLEGLVLKNPHAPLESSRHEENNTSWQIKIRKPAKNYAF